MPEDMARNNFPDRTGTQARPVLGVTGGTPPVTDGATRTSLVEYHPCHPESVNPGTDFDSDPKFLPLGDRAWLAKFADEESARRWASVVPREAGIDDVVLAYRSVAVHFDPDHVDGFALRDRLQTLVASRSEGSPGREIVIPVLYDGDDLADVAAQTHLTSDEVIRIHSESVYHVFAIGFQPGFPYAGYLPVLLRSVPRRKMPRVRVPSGSVAIAAGQTGVYPSALPGGWNLLGRTPLKIVDMAAGHFPIRAGDSLRFQPIGVDEFQSRQGELLA